MQIPYQIGNICQAIFINNSKENIEMAKFELNIGWKTIISSISAIVVLIGTIVGYAFAADAKYVDITELDNAQVQMASNIGQMQYDIQKQRILDRIKDYEDKKLYIEDKEIDGTATPTDLKRLNRHNNDINKLQRDLDRLK